MYYNITNFFSQFVVTPTGCIVNAMDLKIFPNTIVLLKVDRFKGFSNWSNVDELAINNMTRCNYKNYKLNPMCISICTVNGRYSSYVLF